MSVQQIQPTASRRWDATSGGTRSQEQGLSSCLFANSLPRARHLPWVGSVKVCPLAQTGPNLSHRVYLGRAQRYIAQQCDLFD